MSNYLFTSERLGFRNWQQSDFLPMTDLCMDKDVMEFFPSTLNQKQVKEFIARMQKSYVKHRFCYFAVDILETQKFIGFIGLSKQTFETDFTPIIDIGWRLKKSEWNKGFATEGAKRCLKFGFEELTIETIFAIAPELNIKSQKIMQKIGMKYKSSFLHPNISKTHPLQKCVLYHISNS